VRPEIADLAADAPEPNRSQERFLGTLFATLDRFEVRYCVMTSYESTRLEPVSDLDLAIHPDDFEKLQLVFNELVGHGYRPIQYRNYAVGGHYYVFARLNAGVLTLTAVDVIVEHRRNGLQLARGQALVARRRRHGFFWIPDPRDEFSYVLTKNILKGHVSDRQIGRLRQLVLEIGMHEARRITQDWFGCEYGLPEALSREELEPLLATLKRRLWMNQLRRHPLRVLCHRAEDMFRLFKRWIVPSGLFLVVFGPDGVGKSTAVEQLLSDLGPAFRHHKVFHWRPYLFSVSRVRPSTNDPHELDNDPLFLSVLRVAVHVIDYCLGYWLMIRPCVARSGLVLFDRYYEDLIVDPRRFRYGGPARLLEVLLNVRPNPDCVLILDAPDEVILSRKEELGPAEIRRQRRAYLGLANQGIQSHVVDAAQSRAKVRAEILSIVIAYLGTRLQQQAFGISKPAKP
jgi:thymidylate kinase